MDELIYSFLLQSDYPRASIVLDLDLLGDAVNERDRVHSPSFVIVDPDTAELLAVIEVVDAVDAETLREAAIATGAFASRLAGRRIQGFVIRVDVRGRTEDEQVQFYRIWPNSTLQQLSSKSFPDLDTLKVARKLVMTESESMTISAGPESSGSDIEPVGTEVTSTSGSDIRPGVGLYLPAIVLVTVVLIESFMNVSRGTSLLSLTQGVLLFGAAALFSLPAALRYLRR